VVFALHKETLLSRPGRKEGEGKEETEAKGLMLLDVLAVDVVESVGEECGEREVIGEKD